jgi:glycosyltransferase involved in cell wall biosynthesis
LPILLKHAKEADLIQVSSGNLTFPSWIASRILKKPICCYVHHLLGKYWLEVRGKLIGNIFANFEKFFLTRKFDAMIFQNSSTLNLGKKLGIYSKGIFLLNPGVEWRKFQLRLKKEDFVLTVGSISMDKSLVKLKGLKYLIDAAKELRDVKFVLVGGGRGLKLLKKEAPPNVIFKGVLKGKELIELYNRALIFCLPSLIEGFGLSLLEAMASGCAIISTIDIGQKGILIKPKESKEIVKGIKYLLQNKRKAKKWGRENRKLAKKFKWKSFIYELIKIYELISKK